MRRLQVAESQRMISLCPAITPEFNGRFFGGGRGKGVISILSSSFGLVINTLQKMKIFYYIQQEQISINNSQ